MSRILSKSQVRVSDTNTLGHIFFKMLKIKNKEKIVKINKKQSEGRDKMAGY